MSVYSDIRFLFACVLINAARTYVLERVAVRGAAGYYCWDWERGGDGRYGHAYFCGERFKAHVLSYLAFVGTIRRNEIVDHFICDRPICSNPTHLEAVTQSINMKRCWKKGRGVSPIYKSGDEQ